MNAYTDAVVMTLFPRTSGRTADSGGARISLAGDGLDHSLSVAAYRAVSAVSQLTTRAAGTFRDWQRRRATMYELARLDDRLLRDIGLSRADIRDVARSLAAQPRQATPVVEQKLKA